ncbi:hypothetical protein [Streptomyces dysideae]|uniref:Uncharacterized protein n=1 Tax=Streptomyces dysideae TaxID=909626 RepID=A0A101USC3_9ACTN|nr:hypothetical protein [Streptomyces dysideae]KUO15900.1 hypothetical protein AQJ91_39100 [Streptomyces dysideae]
MAAGHRRELGRVRPDAGCLDGRSHGPGGWFLGPAYVGGFGGWFLGLAGVVGAHGERPPFGPAYVSRVDGRERIGRAVDAPA